MPNFTAAILTIGDELLNATVVDSNSTWIEEQLIPLGWEVRTKIAVRDEKEDIISALEYLRQKAQLIIITGGLGPTDDDLTRETVAEFAGLDLFADERIKRILRHRFKEFNVTYPEANDRQAMFPKGTEIILNPRGTAPGFFLDLKDGRLMLACFPGVPSELKAMFGKLKDILREAGRINEKHRGIMIRTVGLPESVMAKELRDHPTSFFRIGTVCHPGYNDIRLDPVGELENAEEKAENWFNSLEVIPRKTYAFDSGVELSDCVTNLLKEKRLKLAVAESCTGGLFGKLITDIPGSSQAFVGGVVTYSNQWKHRELGVSAETLERFGAVSYECAVEMVRGISARQDADLFISITGIAGPGGGSKQKPVGTVFIGFFDKNTIRVYHYRMPGDRAMIRMSSAVTSLSLIWEFLQKGDVDTANLYGLVDYKIIKDKS